MLIFLHVPKSAGFSVFKSTGHSVIKKCIPKFSTPVHTLLKNGNRERINCPFVFSHVPYGIHEIIDAADFEYATFLRNPVSRWLSALYHSTQPRFNNSTTHFTLFFALKDSKTPEEFLERCLDHQINYNIITRQLSGLEDYTNTKQFVRGKKKTGRIYSPYNEINSHYDDDIMKEFYEQALLNVITFKFVGFQDTFDKSIKEFSDLFNFDYSKSQHLNKTKNSTGFDFSSDKCKEILKELNRWDISLYDKVKNNV